MRLPVPAPACAQERAQEEASHAATAALLQQAAAQAIAAAQAATTLPLPVPAAVVLPVLAPALAEAAAKAGAAPAAAVEEKEGKRKRSPSRSRCAHMPNLCACASPRYTVRPLPTMSLHFWVGLSRAAMALVARGFGWCFVGGMVSRGWFMG